MIKEESKRKHLYAVSGDELQPISVMFVEKRVKQSFQKGIE